MTLEEIERRYLTEGNTPEQSEIQMLELGMTTDEAEQMLCDWELECIPQKVRASTG